MRQKRYRSALEEPTINLTPLIDVVFVILIMFIVVAPLLEIDRIELAEGGATEHDVSQSVQEKSPIVIHVFGDNLIAFNQRPVSLKELDTHLADAKKYFPQARPQLFHDRKATFGTYQSVKNAIEKAGFSQMDVILKPE